ncbi:MAG TPA: hypothetical protein VFD58_26795 [Blastocatellia bacterium]|nr:hypothetical protein [Blastocatellia bacterium]
MAACAARPLPDNATCQRRRTRYDPYQIIIKNNHLTVAVLTLGLISGIKGAISTADDEESWTAMGIAVNNSRRQIIQLLRAAAAGS